MLYSLGDTSATLDEASSGFREVLDCIPELSGMVTAVFRLASELRKTTRRVNALQYIFIPQYEETVAFIISNLEEREREETFRLKLLKTRSAHSKSDQAHDDAQPYHDVARNEPGQEK
jgi:V/A-type H+-transporting ATPase subunit D